MSIIEKLIGEIRISFLNRNNSSSTKNSVKNSVKSKNVQTVQQASSITNHIHGSNPTYPQESRKKEVIKEIWFQVTRHRQQVTLYLKGKRDRTSKEIREDFENTVKYFRDHSVYLGQDFVNAFNRLHCEAGILMSDHGFSDIFTRTRMINYLVADLEKEVRRSLE